MFSKLNLNPFKAIRPPAGSSPYAKILYHTFAQKCEDTLFIFNGIIRFSIFNVGLIDYLTLGLLAILELPAPMLFSALEDARWYWYVLLSPVLLLASILYVIGNVTRALCSISLTVACMPFIFLVHMVVAALAKKDFKIASQLLVVDLEPEEHQRYETHFASAQERAEYLKTRIENGNALKAKLVAAKCAPEIIESECNSYAAMTQKISEGIALYMPKNRAPSSL